MNKHGWTYKKLGDICDIICGQDHKKVASPKGKYPIYGTGGIMGYATEYRCPACSVIVGRKGNINNPIYVEENYWNVDTAFGIVPSKTSLSSKFFFYFCKNYDFTRHNVAVTIPSLRRIDLLKIPIPVPDLNEQERIVAELDLLSSVIDKKKAQLKEYDQLAQSIFYDMFGDPITNEKGWDVKMLGDVCSSMTKGPFGSDIKKSLYVPKSEDTYKVYIQINAIEQDVTLGSYYISKEYFDSKMFRFEVKPNDYIITCDGTLGKYVRLPKSIEKGIISASLLRLTLNENINHKFFEYIWDCYILPQQTKDIRNTALKHLPSASKMSKTPLPLPPLSVQQSFAERIEAIKKQKALVQASIAETETLFNSRMDYYFN